MGVKGLWTVLTPLCERKPLYELQGKTVAIDLSCWVVESQLITDNVVQPKMYLRNLYFRTANLLLQDIYPVFVLEGEAPILKHKTIARRNDAQQLKNTGFIVERKMARKGGRSRFNGVLRECERMLNHMGLKCVQGYGEAEAMCAYLNEDGLVDGCISQDSDCFLYGARIVYRNFSTSTQGSHAASGGAIDVYSMDKIEKAFNMGRNKMIALALLCGCDYDDGLDGIRTDASMKLFQLVKDEDVLNRIKSWRTDKKFERMEAEISNTNICTSCGHQGKVRAHAKSGCLDCCTIKSCSDAYKEKRKLIVNEIKLRKKAMFKDGFPNQEIMDEYLVRKGPVPSKLELKWKQPNVVQFVLFMEDRMGWESQYCFEKIFPLMTRWQLLNLPEIALRESITFTSYTGDLPVSALVFPDHIKKVRNIKSVASYEIIWNDEEGFLEGLVELQKSGEQSDKDERDSENIESLPGMTSIEPQSMVIKCYPELVEKFEAAKAAKKRKPAKPREKKTKEPKSKKVAEPKEAKSKKPSEPKITEPEKSSEEKKDKPIKAMKRGKKKAAEVANNKKIDELITRNVANLGESFEKIEITPKRLKQGPQFDKVLMAQGTTKLNNTLDRMFDNLTVDDFASECEELDMSEIIDKICSKKTYNHDFISDNDNKVEVWTNSNDVRESVAVETETNGDLLYDEFELEANENNSDITTIPPQIDVSLQKDPQNSYDKKYYEALDKELNEKSADHETTDEFCDIDNYVPLSQRIDIPKQNAPHEELQRSSKEKYSLGLSDLMNDSEF